MTTTLTKTRSLTVDYDSFQKSRPRAFPLKRRSNRNTKIRLEQDDDDSSRLTLYYQADQIPSREDILEWSYRTLFSGQAASIDRTMTITVVLFGNMEQGQKELTFEFVPGDLVGMHLAGGERGSLL